MSDNDKTPGEIFSGYDSIFPRPQPPSSGMSRLNELVGRPTVQGLYYNSKVVVLDGYQFVGCRFDNCTLIISSTNFQLWNCVLDPSTLIQYGSEPLKVIQLYNSRSEWVYEGAPVLAPMRNDDGTITINGIPR